MRVAVNLPVLCVLILLLAAGCGALPAAEMPAPQGTEPPLGVEETEPPAALEPTKSAPLATTTASVSLTALSTTPPQPTIPEKRRLTLEFPPELRAGDSDIVRLTLEVDVLGNLTPTAQIAGNEVTGQTVEIPNLFDTHTVTAEARLDLAGVDVRPPGVISEPLTAGEAVTFFWSVQPPDTGVFRGTVWLHLRFHDRATWEESRKAISAQPIEIEAVDFFGLSANLARGTGAVGTVVGGILGLPFLSDIVKYLYRRWRK